MSEKGWAVVSALFFFGSLALLAVAIGGWYANPSQNIWEFLYLEQASGQPSVFINPVGILLCVGSFGAVIFGIMTVAFVRGIRKSR